MQEIIRPLVAAEGDSRKRTISTDDVKLEIARKAEDERQTVKKKCRGRLIALKLDGVTRLGRGFLGINVQLITSGKIELITLGVIELTDRLTGAYLAKVTKEVLHSFGIHLLQVYSITIDNGKNMLKLAELLQKEQAQLQAVTGGVNQNDREGRGQGEEEIEDEEESEEEKELEELNEDQDLAEEEIAESDEDTVFILALEDCARLLSEEHSLCAFQLSTIRCAAHCLNLAVKETIKSKTLAAFLTKVRKLCKKLRTPNIAKLLRQEGLRVPQLDCETRWNSTADMFEMVLLLKNVVLEKSRKFKKIAFSARDFDKLEDVLKCLRAARDLCRKLQVEQLVMGDFFGMWLKCKMDTMKVNLPLAKTLVSRMEFRETDLFQNPAFVSSLYLDPRYFTLLPEEARTIAENHLVKTWARLKQLREEQTALNTANRATCAAATTPAATAVEKETEPEDVDELEYLLRASDAQRRLSLAGQPKRDILPLLRQFQTTPRIPKSENLLHFWESKKCSMPELYELSTVVHAVPPADVSYRRTFSIKTTFLKN